MYSSYAASVVMARLGSARRGRTRRNTIRCKRKVGSIAVVHISRTSALQITVSGEGGTVRVPPRGHASCSRPAEALLPQLAESPSCQNNDAGNSIRIGVFTGA